MVPQIIERVVVSDDRWQMTEKYSEFRAGNSGQPIGAASCRCFQQRLGTAKARGLSG